MTSNRRVVLAAADACAERIADVSSEAPACARTVTRIAMMVRASSLVMARPSMSRSL